MDAVEYLKTLCRMCNAKCRKCEFGKVRSGFETCPVWQRTHPEEAAAIAEKWAKEHPAKTRQSVFLEQYPETRLSEDGILLICPRTISAEYRDENDSCNRVKYGTCADCRREFWSAEVEDA